MSAPVNTAPGLNAQQIKDSMRSAWMAGDFGVVAKTIAADAASFVHRLQIPPQTRVLDVACGTGNVAIPLARAGATVTGLDIATNLLAQARERARAEGVDVRFDEGDAEQLPYPDASFDAVVSMFGAMFAPRPELVAAELARVLVPGGTLAMANWTPEGFSGQMFRLMGRHVPPPPGLAPPALWGDDPTVRERLRGGFTEVRTERIPLLFDLPTSPSGAVTFFRRFFGPTQVAFERLDATGQEALRLELESLWSEANTSPDPDTRQVIPNEYLEVRAVRR